MRHAIQVEIIERLLAGRDHIGAGRGRPDNTAADRRYSSKERLAAERRRLLGEHPIPIAHESEIPDPGDYLTHESTGTPILVVRTQTGRLRAFANLCHHRHARLANRPCDRGVTSLGSASRLRHNPDARAHGRTCLDILGPHIRFVHGHERLADMTRGPQLTWNLRSYATTIYYIFPCSLIIIHHNSISLITIFPQGVDYTFYSHFMLIPRAPQSDSEHAYWQGWHQRLDEQWFRKNDHPSDVEGLESSMFVFHDCIDAALEADPDTRTSAIEHDKTEKE